MLTIASLSRRPTLLHGATPRPASLFGQGAIRLAVIQLVPTHLPLIGLIVIQLVVIQLAVIQFAEIQGSPTQSFFRKSLRPPGLSSPAV